MSAALAQDLAMSDWAKSDWAMSEPAPWRDITYSVRDGLRLYARHYPAATPAHRRPVVCLAGITRNARDFHDLASVLSGPGAFSRDCYALDYRGRGRSEYDTDWRNYTPFFEMLDVLDFLAYARLHDSAIIGTSRGGIIAMIMAAVRPTAIGAAVLNDIGPVIESAGLMRIMGHVGRMPVPKNWDEAARYVRELERRDFPKLSDAAWARIARQRYSDLNGVPGPGYDPAISRAFSLTQISQGTPSMWPQFKALARVPVLVVRGETSDVLGPKTVDEMAAQHPDLKTIRVPSQGHAPLLDDEDTIEGIGAFLADADRSYVPFATAAARTAARGLDRDRFPALQAR